MKKALQFSFPFLALIIFVSQNVTAQSTPNGDFESWISGTYEIPTGYLQTSSPSTFFKCNSAINCIKVSDPYHGTYAIKLITIGNGRDACFGYFLNAIANGDPSTWTGGIPYSQKPTGISGYYKSAIPSGDSGTIITIFKSGGSVIAADIFKLYGTHNSYIPFSFNFSSPLAINPDTVIFAAASSDVFNNNAIDGSMLQLDSVSFTGAASQPALFNGDFETWQSKTVDKPTSWNYNSGEAWQGLLRSTDAHGGSYALELKNILSSDSTGPISFPTLLGTGYWDCSTGTCIQKGGYPYNKTKDTLTFYYKYAPTIATDSAQVTILFRKNGNVFDIRGADLKDAATYQYTEIPFILGQAPDSVSIQFNSGLFSNTAVGYAGADFKVDDVKFKSQTVTTGLQDLINESHTKVFPNPGKGIFNFTSAIKITGVEVTNLYGQRVYTAKTDGMQIAIDLTAQPKGVYIYTLRNKTKITARGKIVIQ